MHLTELKRLRKSLNQTPQMQQRAETKLENHFSQHKPRSLCSLGKMSPSLPQPSTLTSPSSPHIFTAPCTHSLSTQTSNLVQNLFTCQTHTHQTQNPTPSTSPRLSSSSPAS